MSKICRLTTDVYTVTFTIFAAKVENLHRTTGNVDYTVEFAIHPELGNVKFVTRRFDYLAMDLSVFADYIEDHCNKIIETAKSVIWKQFINSSVVDEKYTFLPYSLMFQARAGAAFEVDDEQDEFEFGLLFHVSLGRFPPAQQDYPDRHVFVGGDGTVRLKEAQRFVKSLREAISKDFSV